LFLCCSNGQCSDSEDYSYVATSNEDLSQRDYDDNANRYSATLDLKGMARGIFKYMRNLINNLLIAQGTGT